MERVPEAEVIAGVEDAHRYSEIMGRGLVQHEYRALARQAADMAPAHGGKVLDIGTGPGFIAIEIARLLGERAEVIGMDLSPAMLAVAEENGRRAGVANAITWQIGDADAMPMEDDEFDVIVSSGSLHHWEDPVAVFDEIERVLKPAGHYIVRDSRRLQQIGPRFLAWLIGLTLPRDFRVHYHGSIHSSYTRPELESILERSQLTGWHIVEDVMDLAVIRG